MSGIVAVALLLAVHFLRRGRAAPARRTSQLGVLAVTVRVVVFCLVAIEFIDFSTTEGRALPAALTVPLFALLLAPRLLLRAIVIPCRWPRLAYWIRLTIRPIWHAEEAASAGVVYAALCVARSAADSGRLPWLRHKLEDSKIGIGGGIVAVGLLSALAGSSAEARALFEIADRKPGVPRSMRVIARDWLVADAARAGRWRTVVRLGRRGFRSLRWSYAMSRIAERLLRDPRACPDWQLYGWFLLAPRRRATWPLLQRALAIPRASVLPSPVEDFAHALSSLAQPGELDPARLSWMLLCFERRLTEIEADGAAPVAAALRGQLIEWLEPLVESEPGLSICPGALMLAVIARRRSAAFADIEARCREYRDRATNRGVVDRPLEWQMWAQLRAVAERLIILDPGAHQTLFATVYARVCNFAVYQLNVLKNAPLAEEMLAWLHRMARPGSDEAQLLARNVRATGGRV